MPIEVLPVFGSKIRTKLILQLVSGGPSTATVLAKTVNVDRSQAYRALQSLIKCGAVECAVDDRTVVFINDKYFAYDDMRLLAFAMLGESEPLAPRGGNMSAAAATSHDRELIGNDMRAALLVALARSPQPQPLRNIAISCHITRSLARSVINTLASDGIAAKTVTGGRNYFVLNKALPYVDELRNFYLRFASVTPKTTIGTESVHDPKSAYLSTPGENNLRFPFGTVAQQAILAVLARHGPLSTGKIAAMTARRPDLTRKTLLSLESRGIVTTALRPIGRKFERWATLERANVRLASISEKIEYSPGRRSFRETVLLAVARYGPCAAHTIAQEIRSKNIKRVQARLYELLAMDLLEYDATTNTWGIAGSSAPNIVIAAPSTGEKAL